MRPLYSSSRRTVACRPGLCHSPAARRRGRTARAMSAATRRRTRRSGARLDDVRRIQDCRDHGRRDAAAGDVNAAVVADILFARTDSITFGRRNALRNVTGLAARCVSQGCWDRTCATERRQPESWWLGIVDTSLPEDRPARLQARDNRASGCNTSKNSKPKKWRPHVLPVPCVSDR